MDDARAGRLLRVLRRRAHLTQKALGAIVGLSQQEISQLELGHLDVVQTRTVRAATYSEFGERGSIDLVAWHAATRTLLIIEIKTELASIEQTCRKHDEKVRLAPKVVAKRFGWRPTSVARLLVLPGHRTARRQVDRADAILRSIYPTRGWATRRWIGEPTGRGDGLIFVGLPRSR
jgi:transcriptional regulator with XRE-family HTH domain